MADITAAIEQDQVATSLLSDSDQQALAAEYDPSLAGVIDRGEEEQEYGAEFEDQGDPEADDRDQVNWGLEAEKELYLQEQERLQQEQEAQEPQEQPQLSPQEIQAGIQQLDQVVTELQLNDPAEAAQLATDLQLPANCAGPLGQVMAKTALSALGVWEQAGGDLSRVPPIPQEAAVAFSNDLLRALGVDPRMSETNPQQLADTFMLGAFSFIDAVHQHGVHASLETLNSPEGAQFFANNLMACLGVEGPADREAALRLADAGGRYLLSVLQRWGAVQQEQQPQPSQRSRSSGQRSSRSRFQSNSDLFDDEAEAAYRHEHGRL
jgi:hypothetical protein